MKFTEQEAYEKIVSKLSNNGKKPLQASERTLRHLLSRYYKKFADDETEIDDFVNDNIEDFNVVNGNVNKDRADFIKQYLEEHKAAEVNTKPIEKPIDNKEDSNSDIEFLKTQIASLIAEREQEQKAKLIASKRAELLSTMEKKGIKDREWAENFIGEINITEDFDIDSKADSYLKIYNKSKVPDITPPTPNGSSSNESLNPVLADVAKQIIHKRENKSKI